jgi:hypothetical protein
MIDMAGISIFDTNLTQVDWKAHLKYFFLHAGILTDMTR